MNGFPQMLFGQKIQISKPVPRIQCSPSFVRIQSPELVAETNAWMALFFGCTDMIPDGTVYELKMHNTLVMNQNTFDALREKMKRHHHGE